jgi:hypothetical protein
MSEPASPPWFLAIHLADRRVAVGHSLDHAARAVGVPVARMAALESGRVLPTPAELGRWMDLFPEPIPRSNSLRALERAAGAEPIEAFVDRWAARFRELHAEGECYRPTCPWCRYAAQFKSPEG